MKGNYDDIINLPHYVSKNRPRMSMTQRAAQFAPFAALTGYDGEIRETERITSRKIELDEEQKQILDRKMQIIESRISQSPLINITFFIQDKVKNGGEYKTITDTVKKIDKIRNLLILAGGEKITLNDILNVEIY